MSGQFNLIFMTQWLVELQDLVQYSNSVDQKIVVQMGGKARGKKTNQEDFSAIQSRVNNGSPWLAPVRLRNKGIKTGELMEAKSAVVVVQSLSRVRLFTTPETLTIDSSSPSSVHGIFQARILEWVAISFSMVSSPPRDQTWVSYIAGRFFTN